MALDLIGHSGFAMSFGVPPTTLEYTVNGMGPWCPVVGTQFVVTCAYGPPTVNISPTLYGASEIVARTTVPPGAASWTVRWAYYTTEYPEWVGSLYNTVADVSVTSPTWSGSLTALGPEQPLHVNDPRFNPLPSGATPPLGEQGGTRWWQSTIPVSVGEELEISATLSAPDISVLPSCLLIDGMEFSPTPVSDLDSEELDWSPQQGP